MACGLPVVDLNVNGNEVSYGGHENCMLAAASPRDIADKIYEVLDNPMKAADLSRRGIAYAEGFPTEIEMVRLIEGYMVTEFERRLRTGGGTLSAAALIRREAVALIPAEASLAAVRVDLGVRSRRVTDGVSGIGSVAGETLVRPLHCADLEAALAEQISRNHIPDLALASSEESGRTFGPRNQWLTQVAIGATRTPRWWAAAPLSRSAAGESGNY